MYYSINKNVTNNSNRNKRNMMMLTMPLQVTKTIIVVLMIANYYNNVIRITQIRTVMDIKEIKVSTTAIRYTIITTVK